MPAAITPDLVIQYPGSKQDRKLKIEVNAVQDMADIFAEAKPLRRRAAMLLGQWAVKLPATERPAAYRSLITLMGEEDAAVQLAAVSSPSSNIHRIMHVMTVTARLERPLITMWMPLCAKRPSPPAH